METAGRNKGSRHSRTMVNIMICIANDITIISAYKMASATTKPPQFFLNIAHHSLT